MTAPCLPGLFDQGREPTPRPQPVRDEIVRLNANAVRLLAYFQAHSGEWLTNAELVAPHIGAGLRAVGRIPEIRKAGHRIERKHIRGGTWAYRLVPR